MFLIILSEYNSSYTFPSNKVRWPRNAKFFGKQKELFAWRLLRGSEISPGLFQDFMVLVPHITQRNEGAGSARDFILLFWCKSGELGSKGSPRFLCVTLVVVSFSPDFLRAVISY